MRAALPRDVFGRDEELQAVLTALEGRGCLVAGPAGVGKTRLASDATNVVGGEDPSPLAVARLQDPGS